MAETFPTHKVHAGTRDTGAIVLKVLAFPVIIFQFENTLPEKLLPLSSKSSNVLGTEKTYYDR
jgi:hypothetical protein